MSDAQIERFLGTRLGVRMIFRSMERMFRPRKAQGFNGAILFTLRTRHGDEVWTVDVTDERARARRGAAEAPKVRITTGVAEFIRLGSGGLDIGKAIITQKLVVQGDFAAAARIGEIFGGKSLF